jgi:hypothetical protein
VVPVVVMAVVPVVVMAVMPVVVMAVMTVVVMAVMTVAVVAAMMAAVVAAMAAAVAAMTLAGCGIGGGKRCQTKGEGGSDSEKHLAREHGDFLWVIGVGGLLISRLNQRAGSSS